MKVNTEVDWRHERGLLTPNERTRARRARRKRAGRNPRGVYVKRETREEIYERDKCTCWLCGKKKKREKLSLDHVIPRYFGGAANAHNLRVACRDCNSKRHHQGFFEGQRHCDMYGPTGPKVAQILDAGYFI